MDTAAPQPRTAQEIFDPEFYLARYADVARAGMDPFDHYMQFGWKEGRYPAPSFDVPFYTNQYDVADENPLLHYVETGQAQGHKTRPRAWGIDLTTEHWKKLSNAFDPDFYFGHNSELIGVVSQPLMHYLREGWKQGRNPSAAFDTDFYLRDNEDIRKGGINPFIHWVLFGRRENRRGTDQVVAPKPVATPTLSPSDRIAMVDWSDYDPDDLRLMQDHVDPDFYLAQYEEVKHAGIEPALHYLRLGHTLNYDPTSEFSTAYYKERYPIIGRSDINPFVHYLRWGVQEHRETRSYMSAREADFAPRVSVILPNYNHARYLDERIRSIAEQTYENLEIIILDDVSTDDSREVIRALVEELDLDATLVFNDTNSGNVFAQWRKGLSLATGELIWICESDDFCEPDLVEKLVPAFIDESVNIAFGRIQFADGDGNFMPGLDPWRERAEPGIWKQTLTRPAAQWFDGALGVNNVIANVGGCLFRKIDLPDAVWDEARTFKICGDWFLYTHIAGAGQITFEPSAVAYFRQHGSNTSASNFHQRYYYDENLRILKLIARTWGNSQVTRERFVEQVQQQYEHLGVDKTLGAFRKTFDIDEALRTPRERRHIQIHFLGFYTGGGELFPINLANAFHRDGHLVSMVAIDLNEINPDMAKRLDPGIAVYHATHMLDRGRRGFIEAAKVDVINTHMVSSDEFLFKLDPDTPIECAYVPTLHGSYASLSAQSKPLVDWILGNASQFVYTADRNLEFFEQTDADWDNFVKLPNAMPRDDRDPPVDRASLGIKPKDIVFMLVARGVKRKGWRAAVEAFRKLRETTGRDDIHLLMIGTGPMTDAAQALASDEPNIHFLGYQSEINGLLRLSDCMILPTRFEGESYPLCVIQALQEHKPVIATDLGEIRSMLSTEDGNIAGILLDNQRDSHRYFAALTKAMTRMLGPRIRKGYAKTAKERSVISDMSALIARYVDVFDSAIDEKDSAAKRSERDS